MHALVELSFSYHVMFIVTPFIHTKQNVRLKNFDTTIPDPYVYNHQDKDSYPNYILQEENVRTITGKPIYLDEIYFENGYR